MHRVVSSWLFLPSRQYCTSSLWQRQFLLPYRQCGTLQRNSRLLLHWGSQRHSAHWANDMRSGHVLCGWRGHRLSRGPLGQPHHWVLHHLCQRVWGRLPVPRSVHVADHVWQRGCVLRRRQPVRGAAGHVLHTRHCSRGCAHRGGQLSPGVVLHGRGADGVWGGPVRVSPEPDHQHVQRAVQCGVLLSREQHEQHGGAVRVGRGVLSCGVGIADVGVDGVLLFRRCGGISADGPAAVRGGVLLCGWSAESVSSGHALELRAAHDSLYGFVSGGVLLSQCVVLSDRVSVWVGRQVLSCGVRICAGGGCWELLHTSGSVDNCADWDCHVWSWVVLLEWSAVRLSRGPVRELIRCIGE